MRLKNVKGANDIIVKGKYYVANPYEYKGNWNKLFNNDNPIYIEIGMGKGNFIIENAKRYSDINFIGIEKYESVLIRALDKAPKDIPNLRFMCFDALKLDEVFNSNVDKIYLNFSDPWPKKKHAKRRLTSPIFLDLYEKISKNEINIEQKTDNKGLFAYSLEQFNNHGYYFNEVSLDLPVDKEGNVPTEYEMKFRNKGVTINYLNVTKKK